MLKKAVAEAYGVDAAEISTEMIARRMFKAHMGYIVPEHAVLTKFARQVAGIARWRRVSQIYKLKLP